MAADGDAPAGLFSSVWSRLQAAASVWRRRGQAPGGGDEENDEEDAEATVRSRRARRAAAARRLGRKLAFVSFNLEVLVFVYAFWRARRRSLTWRLPTQALPILVIPALATLIYAAFMRYTRTLDLKDKKTLERLQEDKQQTDGTEPREFDQDDQNDVQNCDGVDDAGNSTVAADSVPHTPKLRKHRKLSISQRDDGEADMAWGHSKDFQPAPSGGLRLRRLSSSKTFLSSATTETGEDSAQKTRSVSAYSEQHVHGPVSTEDDHSRYAISSMLDQPANIPRELVAGDGEKEEVWDITDTCSSSSKESMVSPAGPHNSFCDRGDSRSSERAVSYLSTAFQGLLVKVNEEHPLSLPEELEFSPAFIKEAAASPPDDFVAHSSLNDLSPDLPDPVPPASETLKELPAEGVEQKALLEPHTSAALQMFSFTSEEMPASRAVDDKELIITSDVETYLLPPTCSDVQDNAAIVKIDTVSPKWNLLMQLYGNGVERSSKFHIPEESRTPFNLDEVLLCPPSANSIERCLGTPEFSFRSQESEMLEVARNDWFINDSPEFSFLSSPELVVEGGEGAIEKESCDVNTNEENAILISMEEEVLQDPLIVSNSTREQCLKASDVSSCIQDANAREVPGIINCDTANPELMYPPSPEVLAEDDEELKEDKMSDLHVTEQNHISFNFEKEPILDTLVADTAEHLLVTPLYSEEVEITEVHDVVKEDIFESESKEAFKRRNLVLTPSDDGSNTRNLTSDSMPVLFIPNTNINDALEGGKEGSPETLHQSTRHSEEIFLSSGEINNDVVYSSNSNSYANMVEDEAPFAGQEGLSMFQEEMPIAFSDSPIFLDEVKSAAIVDSDAASRKLTLQPDLDGGGVEENESPYVPEEIEEGVLLSPLAVNNGSLFKQLKFICQSAGTPEFSLSNQESEETEVAGSDSFINASHELSFLSSPEFVAEDGECAREKETCGLNTEEENGSLINLEDEALQGEVVFSITDQSLETSEFSLSSQGSKMTEVPGIVSSFIVSPELKYPTFPELLAEGDVALKEDETSNVPLHEQKGLPFNLEEPFLDPLVVDTAEDALVTTELVVCSEEVKMTEVHGVFKEVFSEVEDEEAFDHQKLVLTSPDDDGTTQNLISNSISAQFIPDASVNEASQAGEEPLSELPHESTCHSEGIFLSSGEINDDEVKVEAPFAGQEGLSKSEDEMSTSLDTPILLDEARGAENLTDNSGSTQSISDRNHIQSLHDHEQAPSEALQEVTSLLEGSHTSSDEGISSEIFSLYSRSSSCVSEINILETLRGGTCSESPRGRHLSIDESNPVIYSIMDSTESNTYDPMTAEMILEPTMTEPLDAAEEETVGSPHEGSSNFLGTFVAPDVINDMTESDKHLDLSSSSFAPVIDAFESLETGQGFSELQSENDFTVQETSVSPKEFNNAGNYFTDAIGDPEDSERTEVVVALLDEDLTLRSAYMSPEDVSDVQNSLADDYASDLPHTVESHCISEKLSPESQDPLSSEEIFVYPGNPQDSEVEDLTLHRAYVSHEDTSDAENSLADDYASDLPHTMESHCVTEKLSPEDEGFTAENDLGTAYSPLCSTEVNLADPWGIDEEGTQQHDETMLDPLSSEEILVYPDEGSNVGDPQDSEDEDLTLHGAYMALADTSDVETSLDDDYASDLPHTVESHCVSAKLSAESQDPQDLFFADEGSTAENDIGTAYSPLRSTEVNLAEAWGINDETMLGSEDISMVDQEANPENLGNTAGSLDIPDVAMADSLGGAAEIVSSEILYDGMFSFEGTLISLDGDNGAEEDSPNNTAQTNTPSLLGLQEGSFKPEDEKAISSIAPYEVDTEETSSSNHGNSSFSSSRHDISFMEAPQECHMDSESEKVSAKDKEPKEDGESKDMKEDVEDLDDDHENNPVGTFGVDEITSALVPKPSVELSANDFDMTVRKPVVTISNSKGSSTVSEPADVQYTGSIDDDTETLGASLPSSVATE